MSKPTRRGRSASMAQRSSKGERRVANANPRHVILRTAWVLQSVRQQLRQNMLRLASQRPELRCRRRSARQPDICSRPRPCRHPSDTSADGPDGAGRALRRFPRRERRRDDVVRTGRRRHARCRGPRREPRAREADTTGRISDQGSPAGLLSPVHGEASCGTRHQLQPWEAALSACLDDLIGPVRQANSR